MARYNPEVLTHHTTDSSHGRKAPAFPGRRPALAVVIASVLVAQGCDTTGQAATSLAPTVSHSESPATSQTNILLITADDLGLQIGAYGETRIATPHIDSLAADSVRFETAYVAAPSCSPSRAAIFTGMYPHANGQYGLTTAGFALNSDLRNKTMPHLLKRAGYRTGVIGKIHVAPESSFDFDYRSDIRPLDTRRVVSVANDAGRFFSANSNKPFFLMVNYFDPHVYSDNQDPSGFDLQVDGIPELPVSPSPDLPFPWQQIDDHEQQVRIAGYYSAIKRLDYGVGLLIERLKAAGKYDNTLIIFLGDNGPPFSRAKTTGYEPGVRTPFIVHWPGVSQGGDVSNAMVSAVDILPTILDAASASIPDNVQGMSLRSVMQAPDDLGREYLAAEQNFHGLTPFYPRRVIRDARYKLIHNLRAGQLRPNPVVDGCRAYRLSRDARYNGTEVQAVFDTYANPPEYELYDLVTDPNEFHNLAGELVYQSVLLRLQDALLAWRQDTGDVFLDPVVMQKYIDLSSQ